MSKGDCDVCDRSAKWFGEGMAFCNFHSPIEIKKPPRVKAKKPPPQDGRRPNRTTEVGSYVDVGVAADLLVMHPESVRRLIREDKLAARKVFGKWMIDKNSIRGVVMHYDKN